MLRTDGPSAPLAGVRRFSTLTDLAQSGHAHTVVSPSGDFNLWREAYPARPTRSGVSRSRLIVGLASVFAGLTVFLAVLGFAYSPVALVLAVPFGVVTYFLWYHASGRLKARVRHRARTAGTARRGTETGGFGAGPREEWTGPRSGQRGFGANARRGGPTRRQRTGPSTTEAYRVLGLNPGADESAVRAAYREKVKDVHPDAENGDEQAFKRVNEAYEQLSG